jgi:hypothetical protein
MQNKNYEHVKKGENVPDYQSFDKQISTPVE